MTGNKILETALKDPYRLKHKLAVTFNTRRKNPGYKEWQKDCSHFQSDEEIKEIYNKVKGVKSYSYVPGVGGLIDVDCDWEWSYHLIKRRFKERVNTRIIRTANKGYRFLFTTHEPHDCFDYKNKSPSVELHGQPGKHVVVYGEGLNDSNELAEYKIVNDVDISHDDTIIKDMLEFLEEINQKYDFLNYPCVWNHINHKHNKLSFEQRTLIGSFFLAEDAPMKDAVDFYRITTKFDYNTSQKHLERLKDKEFTYPTCDQLEEDFTPTEKECQNCPRRTPPLEIKNKEKKVEEEIYNQIELKYPTKHLKGYDDLVTSTDLFGDEYKPIFKALWYQMMGFRIRTADIQTGRIKVDGRINALYPMKAGHGKGEIKRTTRDYVNYFNQVYAEPTSLHAEQLVGKTIKKPKKDEYIHRYGYLARDWLVVDEAFNLLSSNELHYSEARKYIRTALDNYPGNTIHKESTEIGDKAPLEYDPTCPISLFIQPKTFDNDILVLEGDIRRVIVPYVNMTGADKREAYRKNIFNDKDDQKALLRFCYSVSELKEYEKFRLTSEAQEKFYDLFMDLIDYGLNYNQRIRNFVDIIGYTIQNHFLKFCAVQALQHGRDTIQPIDVELAYIDIFEILNCTMNMLILRSLAS